jgi:hypothetical protein
MARDNSYGNEGYGTITAPGNDPYVITVGAMRSMGTPGRSDDLVASYSSKGPTQVDHIVKPDIMAPGNQVVSLLAYDATLATEISSQHCTERLLPIGCQGCIEYFLHPQRHEYGDSGRAAQWPTCCRRSQALRPTR